MAGLALSPGGRQRIIFLLTKCFEKITKENDVLRPGERLQERESVFDLITKPQHAVRPFFGRLQACLPECDARSYVVAFVYLDRFLRRRSITLDSFNVRRLFLTSLLTATKFELGFGYNNSLFASIGGIKLEEMDNMESEFLNGIDFHRTVEYEEFIIYCMFLFYDLLATFISSNTAPSNSEITQPISSATETSNSEITQPIISATAPPNSEITQPIPSATAPSDSEITQLIFSATASSNSEITQPTSSSAAPSDSEITQLIFSATASSNSEITQPTSSSAAPSNSEPCP